MLIVPYPRRMTPTSFTTDVRRVVSGVMNILEVRTDVRGQGDDWQKNTLAANIRFPLGEMADERCFLESNTFQVQNVRSHLNHGPFTF